MNRWSLPLSRISNLALLGVTLFAGIAGAWGDSNPPDTSISASGTLSAKSITKSELLRFTLTIKNSSTASVNSLRIVAPPDSYDFDQVCAYTGTQALRCYQSGKEFASAGNVVMPSIPPGGRLTAWGYLTPTTSHGAAQLTMIVEWTTANSVVPAAHSSAVVSLGENAVQDWWDITRSWLLGFVKIFAIPFTLAVIGFFLNQIAKDSDERKVKAEKDRELERVKAEREKEEARQEVQRKESLRGETWSQMLPVSLDYASKYYLPLSAVAERLAEAFQPPVKTPAAGGSGQYHAPKKDLAFYLVVYLEKRIEEMTKVVGGFYFKDLRGEKLAAGCQKRYIITFLGDETCPFRRAVRACARTINARPDYDAFARQFGQTTQGAVTSFRDANAQQAWSLFESMCADRQLIGNAVLCLRGLFKILDFEANRPFEYWYDTTTSRLVLTPEEKDHLLDVAKEWGFTDKDKEYILAAEIDNR